MGGDYAPLSNILGVKLASEVLDDGVQLVLFGDKNMIEKVAHEEGVHLGNIEIVDTPDVIKMGEHPIKAFSSKPNSSIVVGFKMLASGQLDAFASAGDTGAMLVGAVQLVGTISGIIRPGITAAMPNLSGTPTLIIDVGLNPDCKPDVLYQYAILGSIYAKNLYNIQEPKVALLNIGTEEEKGNLLTKNTYQIMKDSVHFNFVGNIEGNDLFISSKADVVVCDGFVGNVILKEGEALFSLMKKRQIEDEFVEQFNFENYGGTPVLGINKPVIIGHGHSNEKAIKNMVLHARDVVTARLAEKIKEQLNK